MWNQCSRRGMQANSLVSKQSEAQPGDLGSSRAQKINLASFVIQTMNDTLNECCIWSNRGSFLMIFNGFYLGEMGNLFSCSFAWQNTWDVFRPLTNYCLHHLGILKYRYGNQLILFCNSISSPTNKTLLYIAQSNYI